MNKDELIHDMAHLLDPQVFEHQGPRAKREFW